jgi:hypothetical protein
VRQRMAARQKKTPPSGGAKVQSGNRLPSRGTGGRKAVNTDSPLMTTLAGRAPPIRRFAGRRREDGSGPQRAPCISALAYWSSAIWRAGLGTWGRLGTACRSSRRRTVCSVRDPKTRFLLTLNAEKEPINRLWHTAAMFGIILVRRQIAPLLFALD